MPLNTSGPISLGGSTTGQSVNLELGRSATASISLGETDVRDLAGVSSGAISLSNLYGASAVSNYTLHQVILTAGGGGGGRRSGGGGGAGGVHVLSNITLNLDTTYTITFGAGGAADTSGSDSSAFGYTATGGGRGGMSNYSGENDGGDGGSGGGGRPDGQYSPQTFANGGSGVSGQGNDGGGGEVAYFHTCAGGGGGISGAGADGQRTISSPKGGDGGDGNRVQWYSNVYNNYGAGGGGGASANSFTEGSGGQYGGGDGGQGSTSNSNNAGHSGEAYAGAGGGGGGDGGGSTYNGAAGGSALIIIRYNSPNTNLPDTLTGGINRGVNNGYRVIQFTGTGSIRFNS